MPIFHFHSIGENLIAWSHLAAREAGNVIFMWVPCVQEERENGFGEGTSSVPQATTICQRLPDSMVIAVIKKT